MSGLFSQHCAHEIADGCDVGVGEFIYHLLPLADITIYYMDIRTFGKGYEQFFQNAKAMGIEFVKGKVAKITEDNHHNPMVRVELIEDGARIVELTHDMVVLSVGAGDR